MASFGGLILTNKGRALQAKVQAGTPLHFTRIGIGDGNPGSTPISTLSALIGEKKSLAINKLKTQSGGKTIVGGMLSNQEVSVGFFFREIGYFAQDPDAGEILYCYANAGAGAEYIAPGGGPDAIEKQIDTVILTSNAASVTADIASGIYALEEDVGDMSTVPTTAKTAAGAISELHEMIEEIDVSIPDGSITPAKLSFDVATQAELDAAINALINGAPGALNTLQELAAAVGNDPNFATNVTNTLATKLNASAYTAADVLTKISGGTLTGLLTAKMNTGLALGGGGIVKDQDAGAAPRTVLQAKNDTFDVISENGLSFLLQVSGNYARFKGRQIWDSNYIRINAGALEFNDGGTWKPVGGNAYYSVSDAVLESDSTERSINMNGNNSVIAYKFIPKYTGEVKITAEIRCANASATTAQLTAYTSKAAEELRDINLFNTSIPLGTNVSHLNINTLYWGVSVGGTTLTAYTAISKIFLVQAGVPVFLFLSTGDSNGANTAYVRNINIRGAVTKY